MVSFGKMYRQYTDEQWGRKIIMKPYGFISYDTHPDCLYIADLYVLPNKRENGFGKMLEMEVIAEANRLGLKSITCTIHRSDKDWRKNMEIYTEHCGYKMADENDDNIRLAKDLGGQK